MSRRNRERRGHEPKPSAEKGRPASSTETIPMKTSPPGRTGPDVRQLTEQALPEAPFPRGSAQPFRVYLTPEVESALWTHATEDTSVEICGVMVGTWARDAEGPYVQVTDSIRGDAARSKFAEVTFTHETWGRINDEMDSKYADKSIVGWYHTHPDFGVFLSDRDRFIQEHFFSGAGQVALVIDPIRRTVGVFTWQNGQPTMAPHFWVGERIVPGTAAGDERADGPPSDRPPYPAATSAPSAAPSSPPPLSLATQMLACLALFLLGYLAAGWRSSWEQNRLVEGVVAHFGIWKGAKIGLHEDLTLVQRRLNELSGLVAELGADPGDKKDAKERARKVEQIRGALTVLANALGDVDRTYSFTPEEQAAAERMIVEHLRRLGDTRVDVGTAPEAAGTKAGETKSAKGKAGDAKPSAGKAGDAKAAPAAPADSKKTTTR